MPNPALVRTLRLAILAGSAFAGAAVPATASAAHGGGHAPVNLPTPPIVVPPGPYSGPPDGIPTGPNAPSPPRPPGPAPSGPVTPSPTPGGPGAPAPIGPMTGGIDAGPNLESWRYWWAFNRESFLKLRRKVLRPDGISTQSRGDELLSGGRPGSTLRPTDEQIGKEIVPALRAAMAGEKDPLVQIACMISLAKIGWEPEETRAQLEPLLASGNRAVAENAAISLGILGDRTCLVPLRALFLDTEEGRKLAGRAGGVPDRMRAHAAYGLGLLAARDDAASTRAQTQWVLSSVVHGEKTRFAASRDVTVAAVIALGLVPDPSGAGAAKLLAAFPALRDADPVAASHVPGSVARSLRASSPLDRQKAVDVLLKWLREGGRNDRQIRPAITLALGPLTRSDDPFAPIVEEALRTCADVDLGRIPEAAYFAIVSLGQIAGTGRPGGPVEKWLLEKALARGGRVTLRSWAALALGISGFGHGSEGAAPADERISEELARRMADLKDAEQSSAFAIAVALRRHGKGTQACADRLEDVRSDAFRGYFAIALGLLEAKSFAPRLQELAKGSLRRPEVFQQCAIGLGLMGDKTVVPTLITILNDRDTSSFGVQSAVADALGYVGDHRAVTPLVAALRDEKHERTTSARAFAAVALGLVGDKDLVPWNAVLSVDFNYLGMVESLMDLIWEV